MKGPKQSFAAALLVLFGVQVAYSENGVIANHVPSGADPAIVIAVVKQALINREWKIQAVDATSVKARIGNSNNGANIRIVLSNGQLLYEGSAVSLLKTNQQIPPISRPSRIPRNWLNYLRREIGTSLALMPDAR